MELLQTIASFGTFLSVALAIYVIHRDEKRHRDRIIYERVGSEWTDFLHLALAYPDNDPMNVETIRGTPPSITDTQRVVLNSIFVTLIGRFWRAYKDQPQDVQSNRWRGWDLCLERWTQRPDFAEFWSEYGPEYDSDFVAFVNSKFNLTTEATEG